VPLVNGPALAARRQMIDASLTMSLIKSAAKVHRSLGPGFIENIYSRALVAELKQNGFNIEREKLIRIRYRDLVVGRHRLDLVVNQQAILELKANRSIIPLHVAQVRSYLHATEYPIGLIINFGARTLQWESVDR
jgi:GxxExxY protein